MEGNRPLLLKLTVNLTPFGTMILIPGYWSFDPKRDLNWKAITALHRARGVQRQGPKLSKNRMAMRDDAIAAKRLWREEKLQGLRGRPRVEWVLTKLHLDCGNDESKRKRLLKDEVNTLCSREARCGIIRWLENLPPHNKTTPRPSHLTPAAATSRADSYVRELSVLGALHFAPIRSAILALF
jgi:hypothetical protein